MNYIFRQLDVVCSTTDGNMSPSNEPLVYQLSGSQFFNTAETEGGIFDVYTNKTPTSVLSTLKDWETLLKDGIMTFDYFNKTNSTITNINNCSFKIADTPYFKTCPENRFYVLNTPLFTNPEYLTSFVNDLTNGDEIKKNPTLVDGIKKISEGLKDYYTEFQTLCKTKFKTDIEDSTVYKTCTTWKIPNNTIKTCNYIYPAVDGVDDRTKKLKDLYSSQNLNQDKQTFNGKVTLN